MADIPKIVRQRLKVANTAVGDHPDADVLTAFSERSLPARERNSVLSHLARCGDCREIVALALPASESPAVAPAYSRGTWLTWPALRWGFAAAGIVLVASLGVVQYQRHNEKSLAVTKAPAFSEAKNEALPAPLPSTSAVQNASKESEKTDTATRSADVSKAKESRDVAGVPNTVVPSAPAPTVSGNSKSFHDSVNSGKLAHGPKMGMQMNQANQWQQQNGNAFNVQAAAAAPATAQDMVNLPVSGASAARAPLQAAQAQTADAIVVQNQPPASFVPQDKSADAKVDRAKPLEPVAPGPAPKDMASATPAVALARLKGISPQARWTISANGALQRSLDQGATWQDVNVNASPATTEASLELVTNGQSPALKKESVAAKQGKQTPTVFRAVVANGSDVWAGGAAALLYHSVDAGNHWTRVMPVSSGATMTGDILTVDFTDALHGRVSTSTSETWITGDDGQTWLKQ